MLIKIQPDETVCGYLFTAKSLYMFRVSQHPSSGVLKTVTATGFCGYSNLVGFLLALNCDARNHELKKMSKYVEVFK